MLAQFPDGRLPVLRRVADVARFGPDDVAEPAFDGFDRRSRIVDAERRLRDVSDRRIIRQIEPFDVVAIFDEMNGSGNPPERAFDFHMTRVSDQDDRAAKIGIALSLVVDFGDERTRGIENVEPARCGIGFDGS